MWYNIILAIGVMMLLIAVYCFKRSIAFLQNSERAIATVIEVERIKGSDGDTFKPIFRFRTNTNEEIIYKPNSSSNPPAWQVGEEANIAYKMDRPQDAMLITYMGVFIWTVVLASVAMPLIIIGGGYQVAQQFLK